MSDSNPVPPPSSELPPSLLEGLSAKDLMAQIMEPTQPGEAMDAIPSLTPEELAPHFPQLEILECLGRGGMGVVYKARQKSLNRLVALKLLAPERAGDPQFAARFEKEAQALAALNHPHIVTIHDFGHAGGFFYLLMEFVDGINLRQAMKAGRFTPEQALAIVPPVCEALQYAHEHGIVHRDIKPENLLLDKEGRVKIADFGIAKILGAESSGVGLAESQSAGTPQYMAPEQKEHRVTDHRADIYSLGVVLYEMLTGELPVDKLAVPSKRVQVDVRIDEIVLRALEAKPELRYQTAREFRTQVETVRHLSADSTGVAEKKSQALRLLEVLLNATITSPLAIRLVNLSALGWLGCLGFLGFISPAWHRCFGFFGFTGFFGLIGIAGLIEHANRRKVRAGIPSVEAAAALAPGNSWEPSGGRKIVTTSLAVIFFFAGVALGIPVIETMRFHTGAGYFALSVLMLLISTPLAVILAERWYTQISSAAPHGRQIAANRFTVCSVLGFILALPALGFGMLAILALFTENSRWNPAAGEAVFLTLACLGMFLLPAAAWVLRGTAKMQGARSTQGGFWKILAKVALILGGLMLGSLMLALLTWGLSRAPSPTVTISVAQSSLWNNTLVLDLHTSASDGMCKAEIAFTGPANAGEPIGETAGMVGYGFDSLRPNETTGLHSRLLTELNVWRMGFVFPNEELAREAQRNLRPIGPLTLHGKKRQTALLFEFPDKAGGIYRLAITVSGPDQRLTLFGPLNPSSNSRSAAGKPEAERLPTTPVRANTVAEVSGQIFGPDGKPLVRQIIKFVKIGSSMTGLDYGLLGDGPTDELGMFQFSLPTDQLWQVILMRDGKEIARSKPIGTGAGNPNSPEPDYDLRLRWKGAYIEAWLNPLTLSAMKDTGPDTPHNTVQLRLELARLLKELNTLRENQEATKDTPRVVELMNQIDGVRRQIEEASQGTASSFGAPPPGNDASPLTSDIGGGDNSPEAIAKAQQLGVAAAARDIQAGNFRILTYGELVIEADAVDEETGYRLQSVAGTILSSAYQAETDAYNVAMRDHFQKHVRGVTPMPGAIATKPGSYDLPNDLKLVIAESEPGTEEKGPLVNAKLLWGPSHSTPTEGGYEFQLSDGRPFAVTWSANGNFLWVACSTKAGNTKEPIRYFRTFSIRGPGEVAEEMSEAKDLPALLKSRLPQPMRDMLGISDRHPKAPEPSANTVTTYGGLVFEIAPSTEETKPAVTTPLDESKAGVGIMLGAEEGAFIINDMLPGSAATANKRIHKGDRLLAVGEGYDQAPAVLTGKTLEEVVAMIRGKAGSVVRLVVVPEGANDGDAREVVLIRGRLSNLLGLHFTAQPLQPGTPAPALAYTRLDDGENGTLATTHRGKIVVLEFWATWCEPCQARMDELQKTAAKFVGREDRIHFVTISIDGDDGQDSAEAGTAMEKAAAHARAKGWTHTTNGWSDIEARQPWHISALPTLYVIGADGKIIATDPEQPLLEEILQKAAGLEGEERTPHR